MSGKYSIILFDGHCNLCSGAVRFIIKRDPAAHFRFASLQSEAAKPYMGEQIQTDTIVLIEENERFERSTAALRIARKLRRGWPLLYVFIIIPRGLRDAVYNWIARNRYHWFGRMDKCLLPTEELISRFL